MHYCNEEDGVAVIECCRKFVDTGAAKRAPRVVRVFEKGTWRIGSGGPLAWPGGPTFTPHEKSAAHVEKPDEPISRMSALAIVTRAPRVAAAEPSRWTRAPGASARSAAVRK